MLVILWDERTVEIIQNVFGIHSNAQLLDTAPEIDNLAVTM